MTMYLDSLDFNHHTTKTEKPKEKEIITTKMVIIMAVIVIAKIAILLIWR